MKDFTGRPLEVGDRVVYCTDDYSFQPAVVTALDSPLVVQLRALKRGRISYVERHPNKLMKIGVDFWT